MQVNPWFTGRYVLRVSRQVNLGGIAPRFVLVTTIATIVALAALLARIGSDAQWLVALGRVIAHRHAIPDGVPFAASPTGHWPNSLVLAELIFDGLQAALGSRGLMLAQLAAVVGGLIILARDARAGGAGPVGVSAALLIAAAGAMPSLAIARVQLFSLVLFPALVALLRAQARAPSRRIWLVVPLLALWSNLHGAALLGLGVVAAYLLLERGRREPWLAAGVGLASAAAMCLTPALTRTVDYYHGLVTNAAAQRGVGLWGPLSLHSPLDVVLVLATLALGWRMWRARPRPRVWELGVLAALVLLTVDADRDGVWLLMFAVAPAARALHPARALRALVPPAAVAAGALLIVAVARGPVPSGASDSMVKGAIALAHGSPVLADGTIDEQVAMAGGRIWAGNPIDALSARVQAEYLDWLAGDPSGARALAPGVEVVLVARGSSTQSLMARMGDFAATRAGVDTVMYQRTAGPAAERADPAAERTAGPAAERTAGPAAERTAG